MSLTPLARPSPLRYGPSGAMSDDLFHHGEVVAVIRAILVSKGIRLHHDLQDAVADVQTACLDRVRKTGRSPADGPEAKAIARPIAEAIGSSKARMRNRRGKMNVGNTADADEHAQSPTSSMERLDRDRAVDAVAAALRPEQIEVLADVGAGVKQVKLAAERGVSHAAMRKQVEKSRKTAIEALVARGLVPNAGIGIAALLAVTGGFYLATRWPGSHPPAHGRPPETSAPSDLSSQAPTRSSQVAAGHRREADTACRSRSWDACEEHLDVASRLDSPGESTTAVKALRAAIVAGRAADAGRAEAGAGP